MKMNMKKTNTYKKALFLFWGLVIMCFLIEFILIKVFSLQLRAMSYSLFFVSFILLIGYCIMMIKGPISYFEYKLGRVSKKDFLRFIIMTIIPLLILLIFFISLGYNLRNASLFLEQYMRVIK